MGVEAGRADARERVLVAVASAAAIAVLLRPTPEWINQTVPDNQGDTTLIVWILSWGWHALRDPLDLFHGNIFWPHDYSYAYNDTLLALVVPYAILRAGFGMVAGLNLLVIGLFALNLAATYLLARFVGAGRAPATLAAIAFAFSAYPLAHFGHVNLQAFGFVPLALLGFFKVLERATVRRVVGTMAAAAAAFTCSAYYGVMVGVALAVALAVHLVRPQPGRDRLRLLRDAAIVGAGVLVVLSPILLAYVEVRDMGLRRDPNEVRAGSLDLVDLATPAPGNHLLAGPLPGDGAPIERRLFPGFVTVVLGVAGIVVMLVPATRRRLSGLRPWPVLSLFGAGLVLLALAFGREALGRRAPFGVLQDNLPGFDAVRVPARLAIVAVLAFAVAAAVGLTFVAERLPRIARVGLLAAVASIAVAESLAPLTHARLDDGPEYVAPYRLLDCAADGVVLELPMTDISTVAGAIAEAPRGAFSTIDWHRRVNGYSGFIPPGYQADRTVLLHFPEEQAMARARELGVRYVVVHHGTRNGVELWTERQAEEVVAALPDPSVAVRAGLSYVIPLDAEAAREVRRCARG